MNELFDRLLLHLRSGVGVVALTTDDESRAVELLERVGATLEWPVHTWSAATGVDLDGQLQPLSRVLLELGRSREPGLWLLLDADAPQLDPLTQRAARELAQRSRGPVVVTLGPARGALTQLPEVVSEYLPRPDAEEFADTLSLELEAHDSSHELARQLPQLVEAARGLTSAAGVRLLRQGLHATAGDRAGLAPWMQANKFRMLGDEPALVPVAELPARHLGGLCAYKQWLGRRARALEPGARAVGIPGPRGALLIGVQGCGKSLAARATASLLGLPLYRLDPGRLFESSVGASEDNLRRVLVDAERLAPMVMWVDEIDKSLAGSDGSRSDAGTTSRVVSNLLTWLQERERPVFVVMTANDITRLPPELIRRGRLDELFFVDLPQAAARRDILEVHLTTIPRDNLGQPPPLADPEQAFYALAQQAEGYSGAELAAALVEARIDAYTESRPLAAADFARALAACIPLSRTRAEDIAALRAWAADRARPA